MLRAREMIIFSTRWWYPTRITPGKLHFFLNFYYFFENILYNNIYKGVFRHPRKKHFWDALLKHTFFLLFFFFWWWLRSIIHNLNNIFLFSIKRIHKTIENLRSNKNNYEIKKKNQRNNAADIKERKMETPTNGQVLCSNFIQKNYCLIWLLILLMPSEDNRKKLWQHINHQVVSLLHKGH